MLVWWLKRRKMGQLLHFTTEHYCRPQCLIRQNKYGLPVISRLLNK